MNDPETGAFFALSVQCTQNCASQIGESSASLPK